MTRAARANITATATLIAAVASFLIVAALCRWAGAQYAPAVLAAIMALTMSRRAAHTQLAATLLVVAAVAPAAFAVARLFQAAPLAGAIVFVCGMFASVYLRNFGGLARRAGTLISLPLLAILIVPGRAHAAGGPLVDMALFVSAGLIAFACATGVQLIARRSGVIAPDSADGEREPATPPKPGALPIATRMAWQMAAALTAAFVVGFLAFPRHWGWVVITAFIVAVGARGRADGVYKGAMRFLGAIAGTLAAALLGLVRLPDGPLEAVVIFAVLFFAVRFRERNYAFWAAGITLILALLARSGDTIALDYLALRLTAILAGAVCAIAALWFVFPIRSEDVVRLRLARALAVLDDLCAQGEDANGEAHPAHAVYAERMRELRELAVPLHWHRVIFRIDPAAEHPVRWIALADGLRAHLPAESRADERRRGALRRALGLSRRAIGNHGKADRTPDDLSITAALERVHALVRSTA